MKTYRVGIIGFGFIGKTHAYCYRNMPLFYDNPPFRAEIARVCTSRADTARNAAEMLGGGVIPCTDYRAVTENPDIDIADISAPNSCHKEILLSAMKNGKHIYCEKPMTVSAEE